MADVESAEQVMAEFLRTGTIRLRSCAASPGFRRRLRAVQLPNEYRANSTDPISIRSYRLVDDSISGTARQEVQPPL